ncbi:unnamed protein product [Bathycoccus prasinos]
MRKDDDEKEQFGTFTPFRVDSSTAINVLFDLTAKANAKEKEHYEGNDDDSDGVVLDDTKASKSEDDDKNESYTSRPWPKSELQVSCLKE